MQKIMKRVRQAPVVKSSKRMVAGGPEFARRLNQLCDSNPHTPEFRHGRQRWVMHELGKVGIKVSPEAVRKWFSGEARPKMAVMKALAKILGSADEAWLSLGYTPELDPRERRVRNAVADGAVNYLTGLIQMNGGTPSFPEGEGDVDLTAIIRGKSYSIRVALALELEGGGWRFTAPREHSHLTLVGLIPIGSTRCDLVKLVSEGIEQEGRKEGERVEIEVEKEGSNYVSGDFQWPRITNLSERI